MASKSSMFFGRVRFVQTSSDSTDRTVFKTKKNLQVERERLGRRLQTDLI